MFSSTKTTKSTTLVLVVLSVVIFSFPKIAIGKTEDTFYIMADGTVAGPIQHDQSIYTLTGDGDSIIVKRDNIIFDGNGHILSGEGATNAVLLNDVKNVTIKNLFITGGDVGIVVYYSSSVTISGNTITGTSVLFPQFQATAGIFVWDGDFNVITGNHLADNYCGINLGEYSEHNIISENNITGSISQGIRIHVSSENTIYHNNFINNTLQVGYYKTPTEPSATNTWDNGYPSGGNYWSDYNGTDSDGDGIGDTPYVIDESNQDNYPLVNVIPEFSSWIILPLIAVTTSVVVIYKKRLNWR